MRTIDFVIRESLHRPRRSVTGLGYILLGVSIFVACQTINKALHDRTKEQLLRFGANIIVQPKGQHFDLGSGTVNGGILLPESHVGKIRSIEHRKMLVAVSPKLYERFTVAGTGLLVAGITPEERKAKPWWLIGNNVVAGSFPEEGEILLGHHVAARVGGDKAEIMLGGESFKVSGVLDETGSADDFMAFASLAAVQRISRKPGLVSLIEVSTSCIACKAMNIHDVVRQIDKVLPSDAEVRLVMQIAEAQMGTLRKVQGFTMIMYVVVLTLCIFLLVNFMSSAVEERRREIGVLLAMGMSPRKIQQIFLLKILLFSVIGGLLGYGVGTGISMLLGPLVADAEVSPILSLLPAAIALSLGLGAISSVLPVRRISRLDPVEALRAS